MRVRARVSKRRACNPGRPLVFRYYDIDRAALSGEGSADFRPGKEGGNRGTRIMLAPFSLSPS